MVCSISARPFCLRRTNHVDVMCLWSFGPEVDQPSSSSKIWDVTLQPSKSGARYIGVDKQHATKNGSSTTNAAPALSRSNSCTSQDEICFILKYILQIYALSIYLAHRLDPILELGSSLKRGVFDVYYLCKES